MWLFDFSLGSHFERASAFPFFFPRIKTFRPSFILKFKFDFLFSLRLLPGHIRLCARHVVHSNQSIVCQQSIFSSHFTLDVLNQCTQCPPPLIHPPSTQNRSFSTPTCFQLFFIFYGQVRLAMIRFCHSLQLPWLSLFFMFRCFFRILSSSVVHPSTISFTPEAENSFICCVFHCLSHSCPHVLSPKHLHCALLLLPFANFPKVFFIFCSLHTSLTLFSKWFPNVIRPSWHESWHALQTPFVIVHFVVFLPLKWLQHFFSCLFYTFVPSKSLDSSTTRFHCFFLEKYSAELGSIFHISVTHAHLCTHKHEYIQR